MSSSRFIIACITTIILTSQMCNAFNKSNTIHFLQTQAAFITSCEPNLDCMKSGTEGSLVPDPADCHKYYVCVRVDEQIMASDASVSCPTGQYFNADSLVCENEDQSCSNTCNTRCSLVCSQELDVVPSPESCSQYEVCLIGGGTQVESCPSERPYFNGADCTTDSSSCCDACSINCVEIGVEIPDPCNCHMYYICITLGVPTQETHNACPNDGHFDPTLGECVSGSGCTQLCFSDICGNSSPPTTTPAYTTPEISTARITTRIPSTSAKPTYSIPTTTRSTSAKPTSSFPTSIRSTSTKLTSSFPTSLPSTTTTTTSPITSTRKSTTKESLSTTESSSASPCLDAINCDRTGKFASCSYCTNSYFLCSDVGSPASPATCPDGQVFNPNPNYPFCLPSEECPYPSF